MGTARAVVLLERSARALAALPSRIYRSLMDMERLHEATWEVARLEELEASL